ncbi:MAG: hypothetical protein ACYTG7_14660, partial [Planctomycetota bacterium]
VPISVLLYVDAETALPVELVVDMTRPVSGMRFGIRYDRFEWDGTLDARLFEPEIPEDYTRGMLEFPPENETTLIDGLHFYADLKGTYPDELDTDRVSRELNRITIEFMVKHEKEFARDFTAFEALPQKLMTMISACRFFRDLQRDGREPEYFGSIVTPLDQDEILMRWRLDGGRVRVLHGDLRAYTLDR